MLARISLLGGPCDGELRELPLLPEGEPIPFLVYGTSPMINFTRASGERVVLHTRHVYKLVSLADDPSLDGWAYVHVDDRDERDAYLRALE